MYFITRSFNRNIPAFYILLWVVPLICKNRPSLTCFMLSTFSSGFSNFYSSFPAFTFNSSDFYESTSCFLLLNLPCIVLHICFTFACSMYLKNSYYVFLLDIMLFYIEKLKSLEICVFKYGTYPCLYLLS